MYLYLQAGMNKTIAHRNRKKKNERDTRKGTAKKRELKYRRKKNLE